VSPSVDVLLATYNNETFLEEMLQSLLAQTFTSFRLVVSDDHSQDGTLETLRKYEPLFAGRMEIFEQGRPSGSAKANFATLMNMATADLILFADADDVWDGDKIRRTVTVLEEMEALHGPDRPAYVFSDARLIDEHGQDTGDSYWKYKRIKPSIADSLNGLLVCPPMLGCTSGVNRALLRLATPVPVDQVTGHDWWMILVANVFGNVRYLSEPTMSYRLHGNNASDQKPVSLAVYASKPGRLSVKMSGVRIGMDMRRLQAQAVLDRFGDQLPQKARASLMSFIDVPRQGYFRRRATLVGGRYLYSDIPRNIAMLAST
jgi:glycosyltransferase involved in cell wall biosynthesis